MSRNTSSPMSVLGDPAPTFTAISDKGSLCFPEDYRGRWSVLLSHSVSFSESVNPMPMTRFIDELIPLNAQLLVFSTGHSSVRVAWMTNATEPAENYSVSSFIADVPEQIAFRYGMARTGCNGSQMQNTVCIVGPESRIDVLLCYPPAVNYNVSEIRRILQTLQQAHSHDPSPTEWHPMLIISADGPSATPNKRMNKRA